MYIISRTIILCSDKLQKYLPCKVGIILDSLDQTGFTGRLLM